MQDITKIKIIRQVADGNKKMENIEGKINYLLDNGWIILDISTYAPERLSGEYKSNYFCYHLGKKKENKTVI